VGICCLDTGEPLGRRAESEGITIYSLNKKQGISFTLPFMVFSVIRQGNFDVLHTHNEAGLIYGVTGGMIAGVNNRIHTDHGKEVDYQNKTILKMAEKVLLKRVKYITVVSEDLQDVMKNSTGIDHKLIRVIRNGIDVDTYWQPSSREVIRKSIGVDSQDFVIGNVARLVALKNQRYLIDIIVKMVEEFPTIRLVLVGDGPAKSDLKNYVREKMLDKYVLFLGEREDVPELLSGFDLFILPSLTEGISMTIIEAMAAGIPVIASSVGGNPEIIEHNKNGILISLDEPSVWIETIKYLMENEQERKRLSDSARSKVVKEFSLETMVNRYETLYIN